MNEQFYIPLQSVVEISHKQKFILKWPPSLQARTQDPLAQDQCDQIFCKAITK
jgi:hypothetical protein